MKLKILKNIIREEINLRNNILLEAPAEDQNSSHLITVDDKFNNVKGLKAINVDRPEDKYKFQWIPPGQESNISLVAKSGAFLIVSGPKSKVVGKLIFASNKIRGYDKAWKSLARNLKDMNVDIEAKLAIGSSADGTDGTSDIKEDLTQIIGFVQGVMDNHTKDADLFNSIMDGITSKEQFYQAWKLTEELIESDDNGLNKCRVINGIYAKVSGITGWEVAGAVAGVAAFPLAIMVLPAVAAGITVAGAATLAAGTVASYAAEELIGGIGSMMSDEMQEIMDQSTSTEFGQDWSDEVSGLGGLFESKITKVIGNTLSTVWTNIASQKSYTKSLALSDLRKPLDKHKIKYENWSSTL